MAPIIDTELTLAAPERAIASRGPAPGLIHHSDYGVQYASGADIERLADVGAAISMSATGSPNDNAMAESISRMLKCEDVHVQHYLTFQEAKANLGRFIEDVDNVKRLHSSLGYGAPIEFESMHAGSCLTAESCLW